MDGTPHLIIKPPGRWGSLDFAEIWQHRELLYFLAWRDIKVRYRQTVLGIIWVLLQPLLTMLIFWALFGRLAGVPSDGLPYPLFALAGLLPWVFFANAVSNAGTSIVSSANLITKVYFPRAIIPGAAVAASLLDFLLGGVMLGVMMLWYRMPIGPYSLLLPFLAALTATFALALGMWLAALNVRYRDFRYVVPFALQLGMFATPIIYPISLIPERYQWLVGLNPMAPLIAAFRVALFTESNGSQLDWSSLSMATIVVFALLLYAALDFRRMEQSFADLV